MWVQGLVASFFNLTFAPRKTRCFSAATSRFNAINVTTVVSIQESTRKIKVFFYFFRFIRFYAKREIQGCRVVHFSYISLFFDVFQLFRAPSRFRCDASRCSFLPYEQKEKNVHSCKHDSRSFLFVRMALNSYRMSE